VKFSEAHRIRPTERDRHLELLLSNWPDGLSQPDGWTAGNGLLTRDVVRDAKSDKAYDELFKIPLREVMLRFPSAPIHGAQRLHEYHGELDIPESMHTLRVLMSPNLDTRPSRIMLMHNGLNESDDARLYYQRASQLIHADCHTVCILRPFPGHLSRFPWDRFGETPLDRYLWDGSHLFRQFLRYITETQWLLSAIMVQAPPLTAAGAPLVMSDDDTPADKHDLAKKINAVWGQLRTESQSAIDQARRTQGLATNVDESMPTVPILEHVVDALRATLRLDEANRDSKAPYLHVIGYSLGGYTAQSVFMTWPAIVSSCSTVLSGGALRALTPTLFAHPEEWQTVLHSLRYELDTGMIAGRYADGEDGILGLDEHLFHHFQRSFYEVFQQEYHNSFKSRLSCFRKRMFFVVGGDDPIVSPRSVMESEPAGGINLLEIGGLGHFLAGRASGDEEEAQRQFWIPQISRLISDFSERAEEHTSRELAKAAEVHRAITQRTLPVESPQPLTEKERLALLPDGALPSGLFGRYLDDLLARASNADDGGYVWIFRNEIPTMMLDDESLLLRAQALFHDEASIVNYCAEVYQRREAWQARLPYVIVVLPWNVERILVNQDAEHGFSSQSETSMGPLRKRPTPGDRITKFRSGLTEDMANSTLVYDGRKHTTRQQPPSLPDCWLYTRRRHLGLKKGTLAKDAVKAFGEQAARDSKKDSDLEEKLKDDTLRLIMVSRARFNPRYRGRLLLDAGTVRPILEHAGYCAKEAAAYRDFDFDHPDIYPQAATIRATRFMEAEPESSPGGEAEEAAQQPPDRG
jgi:pimeloyl-ACP methyl ester carboxylesterase